jgi:hypothetical protein
MGDVLICALSLSRDNSFKPRAKLSLPDLLSSFPDSVARPPPESPLEILTQQRRDLDFRQIQAQHKLDHLQTAINELNASAREREAFRGALESRFQELVNTANTRLDKEQTARLTFIRSIMRMIHQDAEAVGADISDIRVPSDDELCGERGVTEFRIYATAIGLRLSLSA